jgi:hypothetical protein
MAWGILKNEMPCKISLLCCKCLSSLQIALEVFTNVSVNDLFLYDQTFYIYIVDMYK